MKHSVSRIPDRFLVLALLLLGIGNLVVPALYRELIPFDYLTASLALTAVIVTFRLRQIFQRVNAWWPMAILLVACLPGFFAAPLSPYGATKAQAFAIAFAIVLACCSISDPRWLLPHLVRALLAVSVVFTAAASALGTADVAGRLVFLGLNPIGIGRVAGLVIVLALALVLIDLRGPLRIVLLLGVACVGLVGVIATGSRGPLVAVALAIGVLLVMLASVRRISGRTTALLMLTGLGVGAVVTVSSSAGLARLSSGSDSGRSQLYAESLQLAFDTPLGIGWGQLGQYIVDFRATDPDSLYSHNVFLEMYVEGGVVALVAFTFLAVIAARRAWLAARRDVRAAPVLVLYAYALTSAQFSSDVVGNRLLWLAIGLALLSTWVHAEDSADGDEGPGPVRENRALRQHGLVRRGSFL